MARFLITVLGLLVGFTACGPAPVRPGDASAAPQRVVSLTLATDEILAEIIDPGRVVAVTRFADEARHSNVVGVYPDSIPRVTADFERIASLRPDLVCLAGFTLVEAQERFERSGIPIFRVPDVTCFDDLRVLVESLSDRLGVPAEGRRLLDDVDRRLDAVKRKLAGVSRPRVLVWTSGFCHGGETSIGAVVQAAGARNVLGELKQTGFVAIPDERLIEVGFEVLIVEDESGPNLPPALAHSEAVLKGRIIRLPAATFSTISHHMVDGVERLARALHPDRFADDDR